jgi:hypothetical protein
MIIFVNGSLSRNRTKEVTKPLNEFGCESPKELGGFFMLKFLEMKNEIWKDVIGYEGIYQVSNLGRVKSLGNNKSKKEISDIFLKLIKKDFDIESLPVNIRYSKKDKVCNYVDIERYNYKWLM